MVNTNIDAKKNRIQSVARHVALLLLDTVLVLILWTYATADIGHYTARMDADIASETLLGVRIFENGFRQPDTWVVSTHNYVIMAPNLASFIYPIVGKNMNLAMGLAIVILFLLMAWLMYVCLNEVGLSHVGVISAMILSFSLMRTSDDIQQMIFLYAAYYVVHFITLFLLLILYNRAIKKDKVSLWVFGLTLLLSFLNGLQGMHAALFCYMPLLGVEIVRRFVSFIKKEKQSNFKILGWLLSTAFLSVFATKIVGSYTLGASRNIRHAGEKFVEYVWPFFLDVISFENMPVLVALFCVLAAVGYFFMVKELLTGGKESLAGAEGGAGAAAEGLPSAEGKELAPACAGAPASSPFWSMLAFPFGVIVCMLSSTFTTAEAAPRYYVMILFVVGIGVALFMHFLKELLEKRNCKLAESKAGNRIGKGDESEAGNRSGKNGMMIASYVALAVAALVIVYGTDKAYIFNKDLIVNDNSSDWATVKVARWMEDHGYEYGYSTFNHANPITVMSNNKVKVRAVNSMKEMQGAKWLSDKTWYPPYRSSEGPTCYIVSDSGDEDFAEFLAAQHPTIIEEDDVEGYSIYVLDHDYTVWVD
ncbi:hypothetical protein [Butyrivibrio sp. INlla21]|uniref:hypothetical protein n=1 Tax=Butyrivibrio sp. INlla21 TaxID=1520811 RepID=UPI0008E0848C|nr:hypothetical protein [Butyrivibrio sp. INlla21]SFU87437.1 hypothetical protein SAMN02910342_02151 [Butyrivibrio sp. INlla21]